VVEGRTSEAHAGASAKTSPKGLLEGEHPPKTSFEKAFHWLISHHEEMEWVEETYGEHAWPTTVVHFLHSKNVQLLSITLLVLDIVIIVVECFLDMQYPACHIITRDATPCCNASFYPPHRLLSVPSEPHDSHGDAHDSHGDGHASLCPAGLVAVPSFEAGCDPHSHAEVHTAHEALLWISVAILCIFGLELLILLAIERLVFLRNPLYVFDAFIIAAALAIELHLYTTSQEGESPVATLTGLLVLARSWRFVRVFHAVFTIGDKTEKGDIELHLPEIDSSKSKPKQSAAKQEGLGLEAWELTAVLELLPRLNQQHEEQLTPQQQGCVTKLEAVLRASLAIPDDGLLV